MLIWFCTFLYLSRKFVFAHMLCQNIYKMQTNIILVQYLHCFFFTFLHVCFLFQKFITYIFFVISSFYTTLTQYFNDCQSICITILLHVSNFYIFPKYCHRASRLSSDQLVSRFLLFCALDFWQWVIQLNNTVLQSDLFILHVDVYF